MIEGFLDYLKYERNYAELTVLGYEADLRDFQAFFEEFLKEREMDELLEPAMWGDNFKDVRARTLLLLFYSTGMRLAELIGLDDEMVDFTTMELKVTGKRDK